MTREFVRFLKSENITETKLINSLFVSCFVYRNHWKLGLSNGLRQYILPSDYPLLVKTLFFLDCAGCTFKLEELIEIFEYVVSPADKIVTGAVYTPQRVRQTILDRCLSFKNVAALRIIRIADISCGCGGFLMDAALFLHQRTGKSYADIFRENIFGIDIQEYAIERTRILLMLLALSDGEDVDFEFKLLCRDTLDFESDSWDTVFTGFDIIVGNPPYVCSRNLSEETLFKLRNYDVCASGHPDLYIPFFKIAIQMLNNDGRLGYITMNTFLRSVNGRAIRNYFSRNRFAISIVDFRGFQVFNSKNTYTCLFYLDKHHSAESIRYAVDERGSLSNRADYVMIPYTGLDNDKGWSLNDYQETVALESAGIQIKDYCPSRHGIATLSNDIYIFKPVAENERYYYIERDGKRYPIEREICRDIVNPNKLNSADDLDSLKEKVLFPYSVENGRALIYRPMEMRRRFPRAYTYLNTRKEILLCRDKGNTVDYPQWYAYGRTQSLVLPQFKLFFPKFANKPLRCIICDDPQLMLYNGQAFVNEDIRKLQILKRIIESNIFWNYIQANGKPYASGYYSLSGVDIKHFGIPRFSVLEEDELLAISDQSDIEIWLREHYRME